MRELFHWSLQYYVNTASLNPSSYICLIHNLFPRIYCFSLLKFNHFSLHVLLSFFLFVLLLFCSLFFLFNTRQYCYFSTFSLCIIIFDYAYCLSQLALRGSDQPGSISYFGHCAHLNSFISCYLYFWHCSVNYLNKVKFQCKLYVNSAKKIKSVKICYETELSDFYVWVEEYVRINKVVE